MSRVARPESFDIPILNYNQRGRNKKKKKELRNTNLFTRLAWK